MSGSLRQKLEDEFPEFTHGLIRMLANYLRPVPAMTVIAYEPKTDQLKVPVQVCRNELISRSEKSSLTAQKVLPDNHDKIVSSVACHFAGARYLAATTAHSRYPQRQQSERRHHRYQFLPQITMSPRMRPNKITFWLGNEDDYTRHQLYLWFCECLMDAELIAGEHSLPLPDLWLDAAGFDNQMPCCRGRKCPQRLPRASGVFLLSRSLLLSICAMLRRYQTISR